MNPPRCPASHREVRRVAAVMTAVLALTPITAADPVPDRTRARSAATAVALTYGVTVRHIFVLDLGTGPSRPAASAHSGTGP